MSIFNSGISDLSGVSSGGSVVDLAKYNYLSNGILHGISSQGSTSLSHTLTSTYSHGVVISDNPGDSGYIHTSITIDGTSMFNEFGIGEKMMYSPFYMNTYSSTHLFCFPFKESISMSFYYKSGSSGTFACTYYIWGYKD